MELKDVVRQYRDENKLSQREFADRCPGVSHAYVAIIERGVHPTTGKKTVPSIEKLESLAKGMNMTLDELLQKIGATQNKPTPRNINVIPYTPARSMVPIVGAVRCGAGGGLWFEDLQGSEVADVADPSEYFYLRADGDSMEPRIFEGDLILIHAQPEIESGEVGVIVVDHEDGLLKKYIERDDAIILQSYNPNYLPLVYTGKEKARLQVIGKAVQLLRRGI